MRQTPKSGGKWKNCEFYLNQRVAQCDWWFVLHSGGLRAEESTHTDSAHVVYISMEPLDTLPKKFYEQFGKLLLCDKNVSHPCVEFRNGLTWWAGVNANRQNHHDFSAVINHNYDSFKLLQPPPNKQDRVSIITSNKKDLPGHLLRLKFIDKVMNSSLSGFVDVYGGGHNPVEDKLDAILPYKYHIALENSIVDHYWTEKLVDALLGWSLPFYSGCGNIGQYLPSRSLVPIDIESESTIDLIKSALETDLHSHRLNDIKVARNLCLDDFNIFELMSSIASRKASKPKQVTLKPWSNYLPLKRRIRSAASPLIKRILLIK